MFFSGLDAAYPMFGNADASGRLDPSDGKIVDAIHTCGGSLGFLEAYADIDFFPNGGLSPQPGCVDDVTGKNLLEHFCRIFLASKTYKNNIFAASINVAMYICALM